MTIPQILIMMTSLVLGLAAGAVMHRSDFCMAGMFRDFYLTRQRVMLRSLVLLVASSMLLTEAGRIFGLFSSPSVLFGPPNLANILGGMLFGVGMVLAGGCVVGTLYKMGAGNFGSLLAFLGLLAGSTLYAEIHPGWKRFSASLALPVKGVTLSDHLGLSVPFSVAVTLVLLTFFVSRWFLSGKMSRTAVVSGYLQPWKASLLLSLIGVSFYGLVGTPLGVTTAYTKLGAYIETYFMPGHMASLTFFKGQSLQALGRFGGADLYGGAGPVFDGIALFQFPLIAGIVLGSALSAWSLGEFKPLFKLPRRQVCSVLLGGIIMGLAARMTPACNVWHLMGGVPVLVTQSLLFALGLFPGAWLGSHLLLKFVLRS